MFTRKKKILLTIVAILIACVYYYVKLPALNIHSKGFWGFIIVVSALIFAVSGLSAFRIGVGDNRQKPFSFDKSELFGWRKVVSRIFLGVTLALVVIYLGGLICPLPLSMPTNTMT